MNSTDIYYITGIIALLVVSALIRYLKHSTNMQFLVEVGLLAVLVYTMINTNCFSFLI